MGAYDKFIEDILPYAKQVELTYGVPTSVTIAQAIHESAGGTRTPHDVHSGKASFNLFGVKGSGDAGSVKSWTWEVIGGQKKKVLADFRAYENWGGSLNDYGKLLSGSRYAEALKKSNPYDVLAGIRAAGYATDPAYTTKVHSIMDTYKLTQYDGDGFDKTKPIGGGSSGGSSGGGILDKLKGETSENDTPPENTIFTIPIPFANDIHFTKDNMFSILAFVIGAILLVLALYSMFLSNNPLSAMMGGKS
jgi:Mannosyl-glycoprotein endo-beta-N-acetylglucosaminidase